MGKIEQLYLLISKEALSNSRLWLEEANHLLFERNSYGHAVSLSLFSIEEAVKSWICHTVGIGVTDRTEDVVKEVFKSHPAKMGSVIFIWMLMTNELLQKSFERKLTEEEQAKLKEQLAVIEPHYLEDRDRLVKLRKTGMYVDNPERKPRLPREITKEEAEGFFLEAFRFYKFIKMLINIYERANEKDKPRMLNRVNENIQIALINWNKIISKI